MNKKKVLMVEDMETFHKIWKEEAGDRFIILSALTIEGAKELFLEHSDLAAVVVDACVPGGTPNTIPLVQEMRKTFQGPMVAISSDPTYRHELMEAGCDEESTKDSLVQKILKILRI